MTYYGRWTYKYEEAARQGAAGVLIVHETAPASYGWNTVKNSNTNTMFDIVRKDPAAAHTALRGLDPARSRGADLFAASGLDFDATKAAAQTRDFKPVRSRRRSTPAPHADTRADHLAQRRRRPAGRRHIRTRR